MQVELAEILAFVISLLGAVFWFWMKSRQAAEAKQDKAIETIRAEYQRRDDASRDFELVMSLLREIKQQTQKIDDKLDKKVDK